MHGGLSDQQVQFLLAFYLYMRSDLVAVWEQFKRDHPPGSEVTGTVSHVAPFGAFVDLGEPFEALLLVPYMAPVDKHPKSFPEDYPKAGDVIAALIRHFGDQIAPHGAGEIALTQDPNSLWTKNEGSP